MRFQIFGVAAIAATMAACAQTGTRVDEASIKDFKSGETTYEQVIAKLGRPNYVNFLPDGRKMIGYVHIDYQTRPETFIPFVGPFVGGADSNMTNATLYFTKDGFLDQYGVGESGMGTDLGAARQ